MKHLIVGSALFFVLSAQLGGDQAQIPGIHLLDGYSAKRTLTVDAATWSIKGKRGFVIDFESGPDEGSWADPEERVKYSWFREQRIRGYEVRYALVKSGQNTQWESDRSRGLPPGNILLVTFLLGGNNSDHTANFCAKIANFDELTDALLMIATFDPSKAGL